MLPASGFGLVFLLALLPGWLYLRLYKRHTPVEEKSGLGQLLDVIAVGVATTGGAASLLLLVPHGWVPFLIDVDRWADEGTRYLVDRPRTTALTAAAVLALAAFGAWLADRVFRRRKLELQSGPGVWVHALRERPSGTVPYVGLHLDDGRLLEGLLYGCTTETSEVRDIALTCPIRVTQKGQSVAARLPLDRVVVPERHVDFIAVNFIDEIVQPSPRPLAKLVRGVEAQLSRLTER